MYPIMADKDIRFVKICDKKNYLFDMISYFHVHDDKISSCTILVKGSICIACWFGE